jgi:beta-lactamase regulating signal transducer with metallopeptidase domain
VDVDAFLHIGLSNALVAAILAVVALMVGRLCRQRPALAHGLWLLVLLKLVTPPLLDVQLPWPASPVAQPDSAPEPFASAPEDIPQAEPFAVLPAEPLPVADAALPLPDDVPVIVEEPEPAVAEPAAPSPPAGPLWPAVLLAVWAAGSLAWFVLALRRLLTFRRLLHHARPAPEALVGQVGELASRLGLRRAPEVWLVPGRIAPMLFALSRPLLLLPGQLWQRLSPHQRETLLLHELAHLVRRDHWVRGLEMIVLGLYWWNPIAWLACRELREAEEQCCDAWVVWALPRAGRAYAEALVETLDFLSTPAPAVPVLASGVGQVADLKRRLTMIMSGKPRFLTWRGGLLVCAVALLFLPARLVRGQEQSEPPVRDIKALAEEPKDLAKARADLKRLERELEDKRAEVRAAQQKLQAAAKDQEERAKAAAKNELGHGARVLVVEMVGPDGKGARILWRGELDEQKGVIVLRRVEDHKMPPTEGSRYDPRGTGTTPHGYKAIYELAKDPDGNVRWLLRPVEVPPGTTPAQGEYNKRIENLERALQGVLHELETLRKQLPPQGTGPRPPMSGGNSRYGPAPVGPYSPPAYPVPGPMRPTGPAAPMGGPPGPMAPPSGSGPPSPGPAAGPPTGF